MTLLVLACSEASAPRRPIPSALEVVGNPIVTATVGALAGNLTVRVKDAKGAPVSGVVVNFTTSLGGGQVDPRSDTSRADGSVTAALTLGTVPGQNQVTATASGVVPVRSVTVIAVAGPGRAISIAPRALRILANRVTEVVAAIPRDTFGNATGSPLTWVTRNPALVSVTPGNGNNASVQVVSRPGQTYLVAAAAGVSDSILVSVLGPASTACEFAAPPQPLGVGAWAALNDAAALCVGSAATGAEYVLMANYNTPSSTSLVQVEVTARGIVAPPSVSIRSADVPADAADDLSARTAFEAALRRRERAEIPTRAAGARSWLASRPAALVANPREGDLAQLNVNPVDFCDKSDLRTARVAAITNNAVILADLSNPAGGFTDEEYRAFGRMVDTLVAPVDTAAFGVPSDIDHNGRVAILFSRTVNELTPRGFFGGIVLGFFYARDLLPRESASGSCPGSNLSEMFYVLVPDVTGVAGDARSKEFVQGVVASTIAHEFQHLINASRRLYVNRAPVVSEELWLNEGLSHIAEELVFYRASSLVPRQNIGGLQLQEGTGTRTMFETYLRGNFARYSMYLRSPELNSPISSDDFLATRGATWAFLRYVADRAGPTDGTFWRRLVNSPTAGIANIDAELSGTGLTALQLLRDWSTSVFTDDNLESGVAVFQQPSWNFVTGMPAVGLTFGLVPPVLLNGVVRAFALRAAGSSFMRFAVPATGEALVQVTGPLGAPLPAGVRLTVLRTR
jgi:hypothetical protein